MKQIEECLSGISLAKPETRHNLTMFPLQVTNPREADYLLLDEALSDGSARVTEISESGSVPELKFENDGSNPVLLLDGEELIGAKQNRILNLTILAAAGKSIVIPVSCVEAGRWQSRSSEFQTAQRAHFAEGRAKKAASVSNRMYADGTRVADQGQVWDDIAVKSDRMHAFSITGAAEALYDTHREGLDDYKKAFLPTQHQVGAVFAINDNIVGMDLFDSPTTFGKLMPKLVESYALDALDKSSLHNTAGGDNQDREAFVKQARNFLDTVAKAPVLSAKAIGEGEDLRLRHDDLSGGALYADDRIIHLCAFQLRNSNSRNGGSDEQPDRNHRISRLVSARQRRRFRDDLVPK